MSSIINFIKTALRPTWEVLCLFFFKKIIQNMNPDGTCCYTESELLAMDWRETGNGNEIEWFSLFDPYVAALASPCNHDDDECPAKKK